MGDAGAGNESDAARLLFHGRAGRSQTRGAIEDTREIRSDFQVVKAKMTGCQRYDGFH